MCQGRQLPQGNHQASLGKSRQRVSQPAGLSGGWELLQSSGVGVSNHLGGHVVNLGCSGILEVTQNFTLFRGKYQGQGH